MRSSIKLSALGACVMAAALTACDSTPSGVLGEKQMASLLADLHKAEVVAEMNTRTYNDSMRRVLRQSVYARHGVTSEEVDSSLSWYGYNMEKYVKVLDREIELLEKQRDDAVTKAGATTDKTDLNIDFDGDSVDVWTGDRFLRLNPSMPATMLTFRMTADNNWSRGDSYTLRNKLVGTATPVEINMTVRYREGADEFLQTTFSGDGWHDVRLTTDPDREAREVYGYISYKPVKGFSAYVDSISLTRTRTGSYLDAEARGRMRKFNIRRY